MTLPLSRDITLANGTQIPSTLINALQDAIVGGRHGEIRRIVPASAGSPENSTDGFSCVGGSLQLSSGTAWNIPLVGLEVGSILHEVYLVTQVTDADDYFDYGFYNRSSGLGAVDTTTLGAATHTDPVDITGAPLTIASGMSLGVVVSPDAGNNSFDIVHSIEYVVTK